jgi:hypothetical protein
METVKNENWSCHFDGKHIRNTEYQVVVLNNENREVKLAVLALISGKGETIFNGIKTALLAYILPQNFNSPLKVSHPVTLLVEHGVTSGFQASFIIRMTMIILQKFAKVA